MRNAVTRSAIIRIGRATTFGDAEGQTRSYFLPHGHFRDSVKRRFSFLERKKAAGLLMMVHQLAAAALIDGSGTSFERKLYNRKKTRTMTAPELPSALVWLPHSARRSARVTSPVFFSHFARVNLNKKRLAHPIVSFGSQRKRHAIKNEEHSIKTGIPKSIFTSLLFLKLFFKC